MTPSTDPEDVHNLRIETIKGEGIAWVILQGEADISTLRDLEAALEHVELNGAKSVHLHVTDLDFADAATIRRLTIFARRARRTGHHIKTCGASPTLHKVARLLRVQDDLGLI
jgi:anti-anti-sigma factor